jgi:hypothetical protein
MTEAADIITGRILELVRIEESNTDGHSIFFNFIK